MFFSSEFLTMCKEFDICPNIWSLYEWSDWLTPLHLKTKSRFDTMFYIASTDIANHRGKNSLVSLILSYLHTTLLCEIRPVSPKGPFWAEIGTGQAKDFSTGLSKTSDIS